MKSERRHKLQENVLAHELVQIKEFFNKYGNWIAILLAGALLVWLIVWYRGGREDRTLSAENAQFESAKAQVLIPDKRKAALDSIESLAINARDELLGARAAAFLGNYFCKGHATALREGDPAAAELLVKARTNYQRVIRDYPQQKSQIAHARIGLGVLAENTGDLEGAKKEYELARSAAEPGSPAALEASHRLTVLGTATQPLRFVTTLPSTQPASTQPATRPATRPVAKN